jgi:CheY-like chemotaxis protein
LGDGELILVVEDNDKVRETTVRRLESLGYPVLEARSGPEAITLLGSGQPIALVFSDIVMPGGMTGYDVAEWVRAKKPNLKMLLTSGNSDIPLHGERGRARYQSAWEALHTGATSARTPRRIRRLTASGLATKRTLSVVRAHEIARKTDPRVAGNELSLFCRVVWC